MTPPPYDLDVRPLLRAGEEPFSTIMDAVATLAPGQSLRLLATFKPVPLFQVLGAQGFEPFAREIGNGDWEVLFRPADADLSPSDSPNASGIEPDSDWPAPSIQIDCSDLPPPEPMVKTLEAVEGLEPGATMVAVLPREPRFLFPELEKRGHLWRGEQQPDGSYRMEIRRRQRTDAA